MEKRENQRIALTKQLLKNALLQLLENKHLQEVNVSELCREAGINRSTFYKHYGCPSDVLADIETDILRGLQATHKNSISANEDSFQAGLEAICRYLLQHKEIVKVLFRYRMDAGLPTVLRDLAPIQGKVQGCLKKQYSPEEIKLVVTFISAGGYHLIQQWLVEEIPKPPEEIASLVFDLAVKGWL